MKKKIILTSLFLTLSITSVNIIPVSPTDIKATAAEVPSIQPYSENAKYKYKIINGKMHRRLWSYSQNKWLEPNWTPVE